jgi:NAD+ synthase/NAD+ synthase (glutamine-hydrolysing)
MSAADLYEMEVYALARYINQQAGRILIQESIIEKAPSAELAEEQFDSNALPPYPILDAMLKLYIEPDYMASSEREMQEAILAATASAPNACTSVRLAPEDSYR